MAGARASIELLSKKKADKDLKLNAVGGREDNTRQALATAVKATSQYGKFQKLDGQFFETTFNHKNQMCNFPVTLVKYEGVVPASGSETEKLVPALTYMVFEPQIEWNKKWLTYNFSEPEKRRGVKVASMPESYTNTEYEYCLPKIVAQSNQYREMYVEKNKGNINQLTSKEHKRE